MRRCPQRGPNLPPSSTLAPAPRPQASDTNNNDPAREVEALEAVRDSAFITQLWSCVVGLYDYTLLLEYCPYGTLEGLLKVQGGRVGVGGWTGGRQGQGAQHGYRTRAGAMRYTAV